MAMGRTYQKMRCDKGFRVATGCITLLISIAILEHQFGMLHLATNGTRDASLLSSLGRLNEILRVVQLSPQNCSQLFSSLKTNNDDANFPSSYLKAKKDLDNYLNVRPIEGNSGRFIEEQMLYWQIAQTTSLKTICETGFNAGHSALLWLHANPQAHVYSFDIGSHNYSKRMADYLHDRFPGRLTVTWGDSTETLPQFHARHSDVTCDVVIADGGHSVEVATADIRNFKPMASLDHIFVIDDHPCRKSFCKGPRKAFEKFKQNGEMIEYFGCSTAGKERGVTVGKYT